MSEDKEKNLKDEELDKVSGGTAVSNDPRVHERLHPIGGPVSNPIEKDPSGVGHIPE
jgi:hypothetical protein